ncbi:putative zinc finger CCCH domain-containing protein 15 isoform [Sesbania bispinosa]|nr:putative zinc finger CCCH domain-containing protein 15 isoform [Sesbania bispinosa]
MKLSSWHVYRCLVILAELQRSTFCLSKGWKLYRAVKELQKQLNLARRPGFAGESIRRRFLRGIPPARIRRHRLTSCMGFEVSDESPTSVIENNRVEVERFALPKSIFVRSNGSVCKRYHQ